MFDTRRAELMSLYRESSSITVEKDTVTGLAAVRARLERMPSGKTTPATLDVVPLAGSLVVFVTGSTVMEGQSNPMPFTHLFSLAQDAATGQPYIANEIYQFVYG